jgi:plastocyanin
MRRNRHTIGVVAAAAALSLALAGAAVAAVMGHRAAHATKVAVTESEYRIAVAPASLKAGTYAFVVHNTGKLTHALDIAGPGLATVKVPAIAPGRTRTVTVKLGGGTFTLWCPVPGHAALGMKRSLTVAGTPAAGGAGGYGSTTSTTGTSTGGEAWG